MSESGKTEGTCAWCGKRATRGGMSRHLRTCEPRRAAIRAADEKPGASETLIHLQVQNAHLGDFWLHLEMRGSAPLQKLDDYLRAVWLECCGHLSQFSRGGWGGQTVAMTRKAQDALQPGAELTHIYDFGTQTVTLVKAVESRSGKPLTRHPVVLMARNEMPSVSCAECDQPATHLCLECMYEGDDAMRCDRHTAAHPHEEYGDPIALVNSPRLGECGYTGPAEPPY